MKDCANPIEIFMPLFIFVGLFKFKFNWFFINLLNFKFSLVIIEIEFFIQIGWIWFEIQSKPNSIQFGENESNSS